MAEKQTLPIFPEKGWWILRNQFKKTIPSVVNTTYIKPLLNITTDVAARSIINSLRQMGIIDADGKPTPRANEWRNDDKYSDVCNAIIDEIYPVELRDLFPDDTVESPRVKAWLMASNSLGDSANTKITSTFILLRKAKVKIDKDLPKPTLLSQRKVTAGQDKQVKKPIPKSEPITPAIDAPISVVNAEPDLPSVHIDLQIHIAPDASVQQIDSIFASIAKHLYGRK